MKIELENGDKCEFAYCINQDKTIIWLDGQQYANFPGEIDAV